MAKYINSFPSYEYIPGPENHGKGRNMYRGIDLGFGGYVYAEPGMYKNVVLLDVQNMHGLSAIALDIFADKTQRFADLREIRNLIKGRNFDAVRHMFDGKLAKYLDDESTADDLSNALKTAINSVYGLTSATFETPMHDPRNVNNIVALRGALFMKTLQDEVQEKGYKVSQIKTDSIKIPDADDKIIKYCMKRAADYGYTFEHEATYTKMCLVNDAVYIAKYDENGIRNKGGKHANEWTATGKQFAVPYVFKTLFSHEEIIFDDMCEVFNVKEGAIYLDHNEDLPDVSDLEKQLKKLKKDELAVASGQTKLLEDEIAKGHDYQFVGNVGQFTPVKPGCGGAVLYRIKDGNPSAVQGTKGFRWLESENVTLLNLEDMIDRDYYRKLVDDAVAAISEFGDIEWLMSNE